MNRYEGFGGLLLLLADVYAVVNILQSPVSVLKKALWLVLVLALPGLGVVIWWLAGPRPAQA